MLFQVHILNEETRGPTLEAVVSRMKMLKQQQHSDNKSLPSLRFIAVSATIPNVEDLAQWLGTHEHSAKLFKSVFICGKLVLAFYISMFA